MIYPKFIKEQGTIGVTAPSRGITNELDLKRLESAIKNLNEKKICLEKTLQTKYLSIKRSYFNNL